MATLPSPLQNLTWLDFEPARNCGIAGGYLASVLLQLEKDSNFVPAPKALTDFARATSPVSLANVTDEQILGWDNYLANSGITVHNLTNQTNQKCHGELCRSLEFGGNPDLSGIGVFTGYTIQLVLATFFFIYYWYQIIKNYRAIRGNTANISDSHDSSKRNMLRGEGSPKEVSGLDSDNIDSRMKQSQNTTIQGGNFNGGHINNDIRNEESSQTRKQSQQRTATRDASQLRPINKIFNTFFSTSVYVCIAIVSATFITLDEESGVTLHTVIYSYFGSVFTSSVVLVLWPFQHIREYPTEQTFPADSIFYILPKERWRDVLIPFIIYIAFLPSAGILNLSKQDLTAGSVFQDLCLSKLDAFTIFFDKPRIMVASCLVPIITMGICPFTAPLFSVSLERTKEKTEKARSYIIAALKMLVASIFFLFMWAFWVMILRARSQSTVIVGSAEYADDIWGFGQIVAVVAWLPVFKEIFGALCLSAIQGLSVYSPFLFNGFVDGWEDITGSSYMW